jgi:hypothetical protein
MNRQDKIKLLEAIEAGKISVNVLNKNKAFIQTKDNPDVYEYEGRRYDQKQLDAIAKGYTHSIGIVLCSKPEDISNPQNKPVQILMFNNL